MSLNVSLLITPLIQFITGKIIEAGTSQSAPKMAARATELVAINAALTQLNSGSSAGIAALQAALNTTALDPGEGLALQSLFAGIANQITILTSVAGSTLLGQAGTDILNSILSTATAVAQAYVAKYGTPAAS